MKQNRRKQGQAGEDLAVEYLLHCGFGILKRNYRYERNEIDIIASDGDEIVFVEVKARSSQEYGSPEEAITPAKENGIRSAAEGYCFESDIENRPCRFDVVALEERNGSTEIRHIRNAF